MSETLRTLRVYSEELFRCKLLNFKEKKLFAHFA